jgi:hypothetical protein
MELGFYDNILEGCSMGKNWSKIGHTVDKIKEGMRLEELIM